MYNVSPSIIIHVDDLCRHFEISSGLMTAFMGGLDIPQGKGPFLGSLSDLASSGGGGGVLFLADSGHSWRRRP